MQSTSALMLECVCIRKTPHANEGDLRLSWMHCQETHAANTHEIQYHGILFDKYGRV